MQPRGTHVAAVAAWAARRSLALSAWNTGLLQLQGGPFPDGPAELTNTGRFSPLAALRPRLQKLVRVPLDALHNHLHRHITLLPPHHRHPLPLQILVDLKKVLHL